MWDFYDSGIASMAKPPVPDLHFFFLANEVDRPSLALGYHSFWELSDWHNLIWYSKVKDKQISISFCMSYCLPSLQQGHGSFIINLSYIIVTQLIKWYQFGMAFRSISHLFNMVEDPSTNEIAIVSIFSTQKI